MICYLRGIRKCRDLICVYVYVCNLTEQNWSELHALDNGNRRLKEIKYFLENTVVVVNKQVC